MDVGTSVYLTKNFTLNAESISAIEGSADGYPIANLQDPDRDSRWRPDTVDNNADIRIELSVAEKVSALALTGINYPLTTRFRIQGNIEDVWTSPPYDSGWQATNTPEIGWGEGGWGENGWGGYLGQDEYLFRRPSFIFFIDPSQTFNFWRVQLNDPEGGLIELGILGLCSVFAPSRNFRHEWSITAIDTTQVRRSTSDQKKPGRPGTRFSVVELEYAQIPDINKWLLYSEFAERGLAQHMFISLFPDITNSGDGGIAERFTTLYGHLDNIPSYVEQPRVGASHVNDHRHNFSLSFSETP